MQNSKIPNSSIPRGCRIPGIPPVRPNKLNFEISLSSVNDENLSENGKPKKRPRLDSSELKCALPKPVVVQRAVAAPKAAVAPRMTTRLAAVPKKQTVGVKRQPLSTSNLITRAAPKTAPGTSTMTIVAAKPRVAKPAPWDYKAKVSIMETKLEAILNENKTFKEQLTLNADNFQTLNQKLFDINYQKSAQTQEIQTKSVLVDELQQALNEKTQEINLIRQRHGREMEGLLQSKSILENKLTNLTAENDAMKCLTQNQRASIVQLTCLNESLTADLNAKSHLYEQEKNISNEQALVIATQQARIEAFELSERAYEKERRLNHNIIQELKGNIRVFCRVRPILPEELYNNNLDHIHFNPDGKAIELTRTDINESTSKARSQPKLEFSFDNVFDPAVNQYEIFKELSQLVQSALDGYNVCVFAYGQTGSGKTYTMEGPAHITDFLLEQDNPELGMIPLAVQQIFQTSDELKEKGWTYNIKSSILEIYNETLRDLLQNTDEKCLSTKSQIKLHNTKSGDTSVTNIRVVPVNSAKEVFKLLKQARKNRKVAATCFNDYSSRSHSVFRLHLQGANEITGETCNGTLNLVDLAGSEKLQTDNSSSYVHDRLTETKNINKSLSTLGNVIKALAEKSEHIPYRNSKLTHLLMNSLGGNSKTLMLVNVSPLESNLTETLNSLRFAAQVNQCHIGTASKKIK